MRCPGRYSAAALWLLLSALACGRSARPEVTAGVDACAHCQMVIDRVNQACGYVMDGSFRPFDSAACLLADLQAARRAGRSPSDVYFADFVTGEFRRAQDVRFLLTSRVPTVMNAGVLCFRDEQAAAGNRTGPEERIVDWKGLKLARWTPDRTVRVRVSGAAMEPARLEMNLGDLVEMQVKNSGGDTDIAVTGYEEIGTVHVPADSGTVRVRFWADRPGSGFPVVNVATGQALGRLVVSGAHTPDEEAR